MQQVGNIQLSLFGKTCPEPSPATEGKILEQYWMPCAPSRGGVSIPRPKKWMPAGEIVGDGYTVAWRVLDAQYWGVPQRRKRIYAVADFAGQRAGKILFESEGMSGYSAQGFRAWKDFARAPKGSIGNTSASYIEPKTYSLGSFNSEGMKSSNPEAGISETDTARTLDTSGNPAGYQGGTLVTYSLQGSMIGREEKNDPQGSGISENVSFTLNTIDRHAVNSRVFNRLENSMRPMTYGIGRDAFNAGHNAMFITEAEEELQPTLTARGPGAVKDGYAIRRLTPTECARLQGFPDWWCDGLEDADPTEEELEFWREVFEDYRRVTGSGKKPKSDKEIRKWLANPRTDSAEYKMWGNGVALPCVWYVMSGIAWAAESGVLI